MEEQRHRDDWRDERERLGEQRGKDGRFEAARTLAAMVDGLVDLRDGGLTGKSLRRYFYEGRDL
jgi:hypothetical protein